MPLLAGDCISSTKPFTIKKQPLREQTTNSKAKRRHPAFEHENRNAFHFPEMKAPPADLVEEALQLSAEQSKPVQASKDQTDRLSPNLEDGNAAEEIVGEKNDEPLHYSIENVIRRGRKQKQMEKFNLWRRVSFDLLAFLPDANFEGELDGRASDKLKCCQRGRHHRVTGLRRLEAAALHYYFATTQSDDKTASKKCEGGFDE